MGPTPFYGARAEKNPKSDFAMKQTNICRLSGDIKILIYLYEAQILIPNISNGIGAVAVFLGRAKTSDIRQWP